jgi:hypothetical protein
MGVGTWRSLGWERLADEPQRSNSLVGQARRLGQIHRLGQSPRKALCPLKGRSDDCTFALYGQVWYDWNDSSPLLANSLV